MTISFLITALIVVATPGTGVVYTLSAGLSHGRRASVVAALGCTLGIVPHLLATITGLAALLHTSPVAFDVVKFLGVAYVLYLAVAMLRDRNTFQVVDADPPRTAAAMIRSGVLINVLNPKLTMFFVAFLPQFVDRDQPGALVRMLALSGVFMLLTFVVFTAYGVLAALVRRDVISRPRVLVWMRRVFSASFIALGAKLALAAR
jgi:threonine/homoserine/homoserine lactone efflux protein